MPSQSFSLGCSPLKGSSPPSPSVNPSAYLSSLHGLSPHASMTRLELLTRALAFRASTNDSPTTHHDPMRPLNLSSPSALYGSEAGGGGVGGGLGGYGLSPSSSHVSSSPASSSHVHTCGRCGKTYGVRRSLHRHQKFECGVEPKFICPVCNKRCTHKFNLKQHMLSHHKKDTDTLPPEYRSLMLNAGKQDHHGEDIKPDYRPLVPPPTAPALLTP